MLCNEHKYLHQLEPNDLTYVYIIKHNNGYNKIVISCNNNHDYNYAASTIYKQLEPNILPYVYIMSHTMPLLPICSLYTYSRGYIYKYYMRHNL